MCSKCTHSIVLGSSNCAISLGSKELDKELTDRSNRVTVRVVMADVEDSAVGIIERKSPVVPAPVAVAAPVLPW